MAKYGVTNIAGGGGIGSDEVSVTKEYVLNGKTYVGSDTNDDIGTGTMANNGTTGNQSLNAGGSFSVKKGYHAQDFTVNANNLASQTQGTATSSHILSGQTAWVNGNKINGGIPIQSGDAAQDQVWNTNWTTWGDGNIFMGVRSGHYLNGVNWIRANIPNFVARNIKKGTNVGGIVGTFEGYVPTATDLYLRGNNISGVTLSGQSIKFESGGIRTVNTYASERLYERPQISTPELNLTPFNYLNIELMYESKLWSKWQERDFRMSVNLREYGSYTSTSLSYAESNGLPQWQTMTISVPIGSLDFTRRFTMDIGIKCTWWDTGNDDRDAAWVYNQGPYVWTGWIYRIWLS